jgi:hypothetical protein
VHAEGLEGEGRCAAVAQPATGEGEELGLDGGARLRRRDRFADVDLTAPLAIGRLDAGSTRPLAKALRRVDGDLLEQG